MSTSTAPAPAMSSGPVRRMSPMRKVALAGGIAYLVTFAASIPQLGLFAGLVDDPAGFISGTDSNSAVLWGSWLEVITALACIATAVFLYPATRRISKTAAIGFVTSRVTEAALILVGVVSVLSVVTLKADFAGATAAQAETLRIRGRRARHGAPSRTFLVGPGLIAGINGLFLTYVMFKGRLVPRAIPMIGFVGIPLILMSATVTIFGGWEQTSTAGALCAVPIAIWEFSLGVYLTAKGFKNEPVDIAPV